MKSKSPNSENEENRGHQIMKMPAITKLAISTLISIIAFSLSGQKEAMAVDFSQNVTPPDIIFGSDNANGGFTTDRFGGVELGLRAKIPFLPTLNDNGDGTYTYTLAETDQEPGGANAEPKRWNFEFSINTDFDNSSGLVLNDLIYELRLDDDPGPGTNFLAFDPINVPCSNHATGINTTTNPPGGASVPISACQSPDPLVRSGAETLYAGQLANNNVVQNSLRYSFFQPGDLAGYDPDVPGTYDIILKAKDQGGQLIAEVRIKVIIEGGGQGAGGDPDHFQCYDVDDASGLDSDPEVSLDDEFSMRDEVRVRKRAKIFCAPVDKNGEGINAPESFLVCYKVDKYKPEVEVTVDNQFGPDQTLELNKSRMLCVPSTVTNIQREDEDDDDDDDD